MLRPRVAFLFFILMPALASAQGFRSSEIKEFMRRVHTKNCSCEKDTLMTLTLTCDTIHFGNGAKVYRLFNCNSIWTVFESPKGKRRFLSSLKSEFWGYDYRL